jgi:hypothetical protein
MDGTSMPEAAVYKDGNLLAPKNYICVPPQLFQWGNLDTKPHSKLVKSRTDLQFPLRAPLANL